MEIREELAKGVYLLSDGSVIQATEVAKEEALQLLSQAAQKRGDDAGDYLRYPNEDGRNSIPLYELGQKGYIPMKAHQLKEHFSRLVSLVPEYLKERGLLPRKKGETLESKVEKEYNKYLKNIMSLRKKDIIGRATEIEDMRKIKEYICHSDFPQTGFGLMLGQDNLLQKLHGAVKANKFNLSVTNEAIGRAIQSVTKQEKKDCLEPFRKELLTSRKYKYQSVNFTIKTPDQPLRPVTMDIKDFYRHLDSEMLDRFAQSVMPDFPSKDYYGKAGETLFEEIREKRFCANLKQNFNEFQLEPQNGYMIVVDRTNLLPAAEHEYEALLNRQTLRNYVEACYSNPKPTLERIAEFMKENKGLIEDMHKLINPENTPAKKALSAEEIVKERAAVVPVQSAALNQSSDKATPQDVQSALDKLMQSNLLPDTKPVQSVPVADETPLAVQKKPVDTDQGINNILAEAQNKKDSLNQKIMDNILSQVKPIPQAAPAPVIHNTGAGLRR